MASVLAFDQLSPMVTDGTAEPFAPADEAVRAYALQVVRRFSRGKARLHRASDLYAMLEIVFGCWDECRPLWVGCLESSYAGGYRTALPGADARPSAAVLSWLASYAYPEGYVPQSEWERRRARTAEAVVAAFRARGMGEAAKAMDAARNQAGRMAVQGADDLAARGLMDAYADVGVQRVRYRAVEDGRTCSTCLPRNGRTYAIGRAPQLPAHPNCRCWYEPVINA